MLIAYDGAPFHGFARQPALATVQGTIEEALSKLLGAETRTSAAGRTDAGVHALGQVISFISDEEVDPLEMRRRLNAMCGPAISVLEVEAASDGFDARFSASARSYEYAILTREIADPFSRHTTWHRPGQLEVEPMRKAAEFLLGEHDFSSFARVEEGKIPYRTIEQIDVEENEDLILVRITANSFLQQMVRSIVGTLVQVGEGRIPPERVEEILHSKDRSLAGPVAPPHGLFLVSVSYPEELV